MDINEVHAGQLTQCLTGTGSSRIAEVPLRQRAQYTSGASSSRIESNP